jgi:hypothetical protein
MIPGGMFIGIYSGELIGAKEAARRAPQVVSSYSLAFNELFHRIYDKAGITYLFDIDFFYLTRQHGSKENDILQSDIPPSPSPPKRSKQREALYTVDAL